MKLGFIGLGNIGKHEATTLLKAGYEFTVHDIRKEAATDLLKTGAKWADSPKATAQAADMVFTSLPGPREVEEVALGENGILAGAQSGNIYIDLSTNAPSTVKKIAEAAKKLGVHVLDAPVTGGPEGAASGTLSIMVGGDKETFEKSKEVLSVMGKTVIHMGENVGDGCATKLINNMLGEISMYAIADAMVLGARAGLDVNKLYQLISSGLNAPGILTKKYMGYGFKGNFEPGFTIDLAYKDQVLAIEMGRELGMPLPLANVALQRIIDARVRGYGNKDVTAALLPLEDLYNVKIRIDA